MTLKVQEAPQAPSYAAANIQVPANIATPQSTMANAKALQGELLAVNKLTGGRRRGSSSRRRLRRTLKHKSFIRTYKGRRYVSKGQTGGSSAASSSGQIPIPQVGPLCSSGTQCSAVQNANLTSLYNQAESYSINDRYMKAGGGRRRKVTFRRHRRHKTSQRHYDVTSTIAYNIKKIIRKVFT